MKIEMGWMKRSATGEVRWLNRSKKEHGRWGGWSGGQRDTESFKKLYIKNERCSREQETDKLIQSEKERERERLWGKNERGWTDKQTQRESEEKK